jgi:hypothetical protein
MIRVAVTQPAFRKKERKAFVLLVFWCFGKILMLGRSRSGGDS